MPFEPVAIRRDPVLALPDQEATPLTAEPGFWAETIPSAFRIDNPVGSLLAQEGRGARFPLDPDFDPFTNTAGYEGFEDAFATARNADHLAAIKADIDREQEDRRILAAAGGAGLAASLAAGLLDPVNLLPGGVIFKGGKLGFSVAKSAASAAAAGAVAVGVSEAVLQATQELRTAEETAFAIGAGALLSGVVGGSVSAIGGRRGLDDLARRTSDDFQADVVDPRPTRAGLTDAGDLSAARVEEVSLDDETLVGALGLEKALRRLNPVLRLTQSPSKRTRIVAEGLIENPMYLRKNTRGVASGASVETLAKEGRGLLFKALDANNKAFRAHRKAGGGLSRKAFAEEVGRAMRRGDRSTVPGVTEAAEAARRELFNPLKDRAIAERLLPEGVETETAESYLSRIYNREKIVAQEPQFRSVIREWAVEKGQQAIRAERAPMARRVNNLRTEIDELEITRARVESEGGFRSEAARGQVTPEAEEDAARVVAEAAEQARALRRQADTKLRSRGFALDGVEEHDALLGRADRIVEEARARAATIRENSRDAPAAFDLDEIPEGGLPDGVDEEMLRSAVQLVRGGPPRKPETLTQFLARKGGLQNEGDQLKALGITNRARPGFVSAKGQRLDDAALRAWEEGFFPGQGRPTLTEFLDAVGEDFNQTRLVVRDVDFDAARAVEEFDDIQRGLDELGIDVNDIARTLPRRLTRAPDLVALVQRVNAQRAARAAGRAEELRVKLSQAESDLRIAEETRFDLESYADEISDSVVAKLKGFDAETQPYNITVAERGPLAERVFDIADEKIEDFLESDIDLISQRYQRVVSADVELARKYGDPTLRTQIDEINEDYAELARRATTERERLLLEKRRRADIRDVETMRDLIRGTYRHSSWDDPRSTFTRVQRVARDLRFMALLGGVTVSSFPDIARPVMTQGFFRTFRTGWTPFVTSTKARTLSRAEAQLAGQVTETVLQGRVAALAELADPYAQGHAFERFVSNASRQFGNLTLLTYWNNTMKEIASTITMTRIVELSNGYARLAPKDKSYLAFLGIDQSMAERIAGQFGRHGETTGAVRIPRTDLWDDEVAVRSFRAALNKDVDSTIVTPGVGDKPVWVNTELGRTVGQFKSFMFAANQRVMLRAAQRQDRGVLPGVAMMVGLGALVYWAKTMQHDPSRLSDDPRVWVAEGIDRSGLIPVMMEANNIVEKVGFPLTFRGLTGGGVASRYASRSLPEAFLGPSLGQITDIGLTMRSIFAGEATEGDVSAFRRLLPYQNLFYLRPLFDVAQEAVGPDE